MSEDAVIEVRLYTRAACSLCEQVRSDLQSLQASVPHCLVEIDTDAHPDLQVLYGEYVPVVEVGPYRLRAPFERQELHMTLAAARDRLVHMRNVDAGTVERLSGPSGRWTRADSFSYWFSRHYMAFFNLFILLYVGLPFLAPALMLDGMTGPAQVVYRTYSVVCHQLSYRSFFLFGEQWFYPRAQAGLPANIKTFAQVSGIQDGNQAEDLLVARDFIGNARIGYKVALCERDIAIYGAILLFGVVFVLTGRRIPALPWYLWLLIGLVPIGLDGFSQLLSQPPFNFFPYRESTPYLRVLTGGLFGLATAWFGYPMVEETMVETKKLMALKSLKLRHKD